MEVAVDPTASPTAGSPSTNSPLHLGIELTSEAPPPLPRWDSGMAYKPKPPSPKKKAEANHKRTQSAPVSSNPMSNLQQQLFAPKAPVSSPALPPTEEVLAPHMRTSDRRAFHRVVTGRNVCEKTPHCAEFKRLGTCRHLHLSVPQTEDLGLFVEKYVEKRGWMTKKNMTLLKTSNRRYFVASKGIFSWYDSEEINKAHLKGQINLKSSVMRVQPKGFVIATAKVYDKKSEKATNVFEKGFFTVLEKASVRPVLKEDGHVYYFEPENTKTLDKWLSAIKTHMPQQYHPRQLAYDKCCAMNALIEQQKSLPAGHKPSHMAEIEQLPANAERMRAEKGILAKEHQALAKRIFQGLAGKAVTQDAAILVKERQDEALWESVVSPASFPSSVFAAPRRWDVDMDVLCQVCTKIDKSGSKQPCLNYASLRCLACNQDMCHDAVYYHERFSATQRHCIVPILLLEIKNAHKILARVQKHKSGWLFKRNLTSKGPWANRFVVLDSARQELLWYTSDTKKSKAEPKGRINLASSFLRVRQNDFLIETASVTGGAKLKGVKQQGEVFCFEARSGDEHDSNSTLEWVACVKGIMKHQKHLDLSASQLDGVYEIVSKQQKSFFQAAKQCQSAIEHQPHPWSQAMSPADLPESVFAVFRHRKERSSELMCQVCTKIDKSGSKQPCLNYASLRCLACNQDMCHDAVYYHERFSATQRHCIVPILLLEHSEDYKKSATFHNVNKSGWLFKRNLTSKGPWANRFVVLDSARQELLWYTSDTKKSKAEPKGRINLASSFLRVRQNDFLIETASVTGGAKLKGVKQQGEVFCFEARSGDEHDSNSTLEWVACVKEIMKHQKHLELSVAQINHINRKVRELTTSHRALDASGIDTIDLNSNPLLSLSESSVSTLRSVGTDFGFMEGRSSLPDFMLDPGEEPSIQTKGQPLKPPKLVNPSKTTTTSKNPPEQESLLSKFPKLATML